MKTLTLLLAAVLLLNGSAQTAPRPKTASRPAPDVMMVVMVGPHIVGRALVREGVSYIIVGSRYRPLRPLAEAQGVTMEFDPDYEPDGNYSTIDLSGPGVGDFLNGYFLSNPDADKPAD